MDRTGPHPPDEQPGDAGGEAPDGARPAAAVPAAGAAAGTPVEELRRRVEEADSARRRAELIAGRMRFLAQISQELSSSLDFSTTLQNITRLAVPTLADWCAIDIVGEDGTLQAVGIAHEDPARVEQVRQLRQRYPDRPDAQYGVHHVIRTGRPQLLTEIGDELLQSSAHDEEHLRMLRALRLRSALLVPLQVRGTTLGALTLVHAESGRQYRERDVEFALEIASRAALALDNARLVQRLERTQSHLESTASELEAQTEELQATVEELEATTHELLESNAALEDARAEADRARAAAEDANAAKSRFLATMSHELRTPLNAIDGYAELIELGVHGPVTEQQRHALARVRRSQKRLLSLVNDVLNFARLESGRVRYRLEDLQLDDVLLELEAVIAPRAAARQIRFAIELPGPAAAIHADRERTEQILLNLAGNAVKFTNPGGDVHISARREGGMVRIDVADTGIGIPEERMVSVFEPFVQVDLGIVRDLGGVGLGLSISRDLARAMDGDITVRSVEGRGSVFTLTLPAAGTGHESGTTGNAGEGEPATR